MRQYSADRLSISIAPRKYFNEQTELELRLAFSELTGKEKVRFEIQYVKNIPLAPNGMKSIFFIPLKKD